MGGAPGGIQLADFTVFSFQIVDEFDLGGLILRRLQRRDGERNVVAPRDFVVDEIADAPRIVGGFAALLFDVVFDGGGEGRIEHVVELAPVARAAFEILAVCSKIDEIGRLAQEEDVLVRPVGDGVHAPAAEAAVGHFGTELVPILSEFAFQIGLQEVEVLRLAACIVAVDDMPVFSDAVFEFRIVAHEILEPCLAVFNRRGAFEADAVRPMADEELAVRIDEPPFAVVFHRAEEARGLKGRAVRPAAPLVPAGRAWMSGQILFLQRDAGDEIGGVLHLSGPVAMDELAVCVDEREEFLRLDTLGFVAGVFVMGDDGFDFKFDREGRREAEHEEADDIRRIDGFRRTAHGAADFDGIAAHAEQFDGHFRILAGDRNRQRATLAGGQFDGFLQAVRPSVRSRIIHAEADVLRVFADVFQRDGDARVGREIPMAVRRVERDARPLALRLQMDVETAFAKPLRGGLAMFDEFFRNGFLEIIESHGRLRVNTCA